MVIVYPIKNGLYVNLTNRCPCACEFCLRKNGPGVQGSDSLWLEREPTVAEAIAALDAANPARYGEVVFCGYGEPTERLEDLLAIARHIRATAPATKIRVNTNGLADLIHGRPTAAEFRGLVDVVSISLNTPDADEYARICHPRFGSGSHAALLGFAKACVSVVPSVVLTVVGEPVTSLANQARCRAIAESIGATLRVRRYEPAP
ncbi:MAG: TatD family nuclease-associated radical SAM protein [Kiritimatiellia bacterium]